MNWAYFNSEYEDQQVSTFVGLGFVVTNAASTEISGFEVDAAFQVTDKLRLNAAIGYVDAGMDRLRVPCTALQTSDIEFLNFATGGLTPSSPNISSADGLCEQQFDAAGNRTGISQDLSGAWTGTAEYSGSLGAVYVQPLGSMV